MVAWKCAVYFRKKSCNQKYLTNGRRFFWSIIVMEISVVLYCVSLKFSNIRRSISLAIPENRLRWKKNTEQHKFSSVRKMFLIDSRLARTRKKLQRRDLPTACLNFISPHAETVRHRSVYSIWHVLSSFTIPTNSTCFCFLSRHLATYIPFLHGYSGNCNNLADANSPCQITKVNVDVAV